MSQDARIGRTLAPLQRAIKQALEIYGQSGKPEWLMDLIGGTQELMEESGELLGYSSVYELAAEYAPLKPFIWRCGCLITDAGAHRVGCPEHPEGVRG